jgi:hypothetical protein
VSELPFSSRHRTGDGLPTRRIDTGIAREARTRVKVGRRCYQRVGTLPWQPTVDTAANGAVYFESAGVRWRVYDGRSGPDGRVYGHAPPHADATHRYFVRSDGARHVYTFAPRDGRAVSPNLLKAQLANSQLVKSGSRP